MAGEPGELRFWRNLFATVACVMGVVLSNQLLVMALAWMAASFALHGLLTHFHQRPAALVAAHKKFLVSRLADAALLAAVALIWAHLGTLRVDEVLSALEARVRLAGAASLPTGLQWAAVLLALTACLKCAQLPFHGWLIQVMEAPTPVSALLHAGVVNLGGLVLIRLYPLVAAAPAAQTLLVLVGATTAAVAALSMMTRISIKVMLAWSTCAQMGFMLLQIGLGWPQLALLHLLAHSLYKAHAFLNAGGAVAEARLGLDAPARPGRSWGAELSAAAASLGMAAAAAALWQPPAADWPVTAALVWVLGLALTPLLSAKPPDAAVWPWLGRALICGALASTTFGLHHALRLALAPPGAAPVSDWLLLPLWTLSTLLFAVQLSLRLQADAPWLRRLHPWFFGGLFLDECFTRLTFRVWPLKSNGAQA
jgi:NAD(P)H-quinone oxidoreductase subunit 5